MKRIICFFAVVVNCVSTLSAQFPNPVLFNTASNASGTGTLSVNSNDLNWQASMTGTAGPFVAAVSCGNPYPSSWVISPFPNANWISYPHTCPPVTGWPNSPAEHSCLNPANLDIFYRLVFDLPSSNCQSSISTPSAYCLSFDFFADNTVYEILVNGSSSYLYSGSNPYYEMDYSTSGKKTVSLCNYWVPGSNTVIVHVKSGQGFAPTWEGFLAQVNQTITSTGSPQSFSINTVSSAATCFGQSNGSATVIPTGSQGPFTYLWMPGSSNSQAASGLSAGIYSVTVTSGNCALTQTVAVTQPSATAIGITTVEPRCPGQPVQLTASGAVSYSWQPGNLSGSTVTVTPNATTVYTLTAVDAWGCTAKKTYTQQVKICSGVTELVNASPDFVISPNPGDGTFLLNGTAEACVFDVIDLTGRRILTGITGAGSTAIDLTGKKPGLYFVKVSSGERSVTKKLVLR